MLSIADSIRAFYLCAFAQVSNYSYRFVGNRNMTEATISQGQQNMPLYIYGGGNHEEFLGVINGSKLG